MKVLPFEKRIRQYGMIIVLLLLSVFFEFSTNHVFLSPQNITNLIIQNSYILILAVGMILCILAGGNIDLSVGSVCCFIGALTGKFMTKYNFSITTSILLSLIVGVLIGAWHGFWIAYAKIPSFIATLAGMLIFRGLAILTLDGLTLGPFSETFQSISGGFFSDFLPFENDKKILTWIVGTSLILVYVILKLSNKDEPNDKKITPILINSLLIYFLTISFVKFKGIPLILVILTLIFAVYMFITNKTIFGRHVYAIGGNAKAARCSGININKVLFFVYVNMSFLAALSGIIFSSRTNSASPQAGINFELDAMASCYIGGASTLGGIGTVGGTVVGGLIMGVLNNGMSIMGMGSDIQLTVKGLCLLGAVMFDTLSKRSKKS